VVKSYEIERFIFLVLVHGIWRSGGIPEGLERGAAYNEEAERRGSCGESSILSNIFNVLLF
jgi:hypothetical protein